MMRQANRPSHFRREFLDYVRVISKSATSFFNIWELKKKKKGNFLSSSSGLIPLSLRTHLQEFAIQLSSGVRTFGPSVSSPICLSSWSPWSGLFNQNDLLQLPVVFVDPSISPSVSSTFAGRALKGAGARAAFSTAGGPGAVSCSVLSRDGRAREAASPGVGPTALALYKLGACETRLSPPFVSTSLGPGIQNVPPGGRRAPVSSRFPV